MAVKTKREGIALQLSGVRLCPLPHLLAWPSIASHTRVLAFPEPLVFETSA